MPNNNKNEDALSNGSGETNDSTHESAASRVRWKGSDENLGGTAAV